MPAEASARAPFASDFRVGDWLVEPSLDRVSRNGTVVRLRPQLTNLLVVLAQHPGRTVSKEEILSKVWEGQFVAESGMTRCIAEIRQALEDDAREPRILETIPKRGYRLVAPVVFLEEAAGEARASGPPVQEARREAEEQAAVSATDKGTPSCAPAESATTVEETGSARRPRPTASWSVRALLGTVSLACLAWGAVAWSPSPMLSEQDSVLLADVTNTTGDAAFDQTLRFALAVNLGQAPFLRILTADQLRSGLTRMGRKPDEAVTGAVALELCRREGAAILLAGSIARLGSHYAVGLDAIACATGESVARQLVEVEGKDGVLSALGTAAGRIRRSLGESRASLTRHDVPIVEATTPSLEALKALSLGDLNRDQARLEASLACYRRATELDPLFALAWARRGAMARNLGYTAGEDRFDGMDEMTFAFTEAYELRDRVSEPERFYITAHYQRLVEGDPEKAVETYRMWRRTYPGSVVPPTNLASVFLDTLGRYNEALVEAREAVRLAPLSSIANSMLVRAYMATDRLDEARQALRQGADRGASDLLWHQNAFDLAFASADEAALRDESHWAPGSAVALGPMVESRAQAAAVTGRFLEARQLWDAAAALAAGASRNAAHVRLAEAEAEALLGDPGRARAALGAALALDRRPRVLLTGAVVLATIRDHTGAQQLIDEAGRGRTPDTCAKYVWGPVSRAVVLSARGENVPALQALAQASAFERGTDFGLAPLCIRGMLELAAGRPRESAAAFEQVLRFRNAAPLSPWLAYARLGLARARHQAGDVAGSGAAYDALVETMTHADVDAPVLLAARRERAALRNR